MVAAACFAGIFSKGQTVEFKFTPSPNTLGPGGSDFTAPSTLTFDASSGSITSSGEFIPAISYVFQTPDSYLTSANSRFGQFYYYYNPVETVTWSPTAISQLALETSASSYLGHDYIFQEFDYAQDDITLTSISYQSGIELAGGPYFEQSGGVLTGTWALDTPDASSTGLMLELGICSLITARRRLQRKDPPLQRCLPIDRHNHFK